MPRVDNLDRFGRYSRLRFYRLIIDKKSDKKRIGLRDRNFIERVKLLNSKNYVVPEKYKHRPDLISYEVYGTPKLWWIITDVNDIRHPLKDLETQKALKIPDSDQLFALLL